jgi:hypothetical protein
MKKVLTFLSQIYFMKKLLFALLITLSVASVASASYLPGNDGTAAVMTFTTDKHDFKVIPQGTPVTYDFTFTNTGKEPLLIKNAVGSCGCTVPEYTQEAIAPGGKGKVKVTYNAASIGTFIKTVTVNTNSASTPVITLTINGEVKATTDTQSGVSAAVKTEKAAKPTSN